MHRHLLLVVAPLLLVVAVIADDADDAKPAATIKVTEIDLSDVPAAIVKGKPTEPAVITTAAELAKAFPNANVAARIKKAVDFEKEKLVYFAWSGSGQDEITYTVEKGEKGAKVEGEKVVFHYLAGRTRDLRGHHKLFKLPLAAPFEVARAR